MGAKKQRSVDWGNFAILAVLLLMIIVLTIMNPVFLSMDNLVNIARQISMVAIVAIGMTFVLIIGEIDLSVGHIACLSGIIVAKCLTLR